MSAADSGGCTVCAARVLAAAHCTLHGVRIGDSTLCTRTLVAARCAAHCHRPASG
ncbi:hypothetical protein [Paraburkholderia aspalathi]|uniref:hypothetical protein n=1 Tax=Paraburkholderia aspalathi TaxID=1324617 RepID=UPI00190913A2|nr:hypothetical protein [Paraburkholderia aspalathi]MBK3823470.1 hypothetical protein [Paraburkholderia aspalathi]